MARDKSTASISRLFFDRPFKEIPRRLLFSVIRQRQRQLRRTADLCCQDFLLNPRADIVLASVDEPLDGGDDEHDAKRSHTVVYEAVSA